MVIVFMLIFFFLEKHEQRWWTGGECDVGLAARCCRGAHVAAPCCQAAELLCYIYSIIIIQRSTGTTLPFLIQSFPCDI